MKTCTTCRYCEPAGGDTICRRFPRTVMAREGQPNVNMLPLVIATDWCGEYRRKSWWRFW